MFTTVVLVCLSGELHSAETCYTFTNESITETVEECEYAAYIGLRDGYFIYEDPENGDKYIPVDWHCVNWNGKRV